MKRPQHKARVYKTRLMGWVAKVPREDGSMKSVPCGSWAKCIYFAEWYMLNHHKEN